MNIWTILQIGLIVTAAAITGLGSRYVWPDLKDDNPIEEAAEDIIYGQTCVNIDLTPSSKEYIAKKIESA